MNGSFATGHLRVQDINLKHAMRIQLRTTRRHRRGDIALCLYVSIAVVADHVSECLPSLQPRQKADTIVARARSGNRQEKYSRNELNRVFHNRFDAFTAAHSNEPIRTFESQS